MDLTRRRLFAGIGALIAAPAIVRVASIMPVRSLPGFATATNPYWDAATYHSYHSYQAIGLDADLMEVIFSITRGQPAEMRGFA